MPIYMDLHLLPGIKANDVATAHQQDLLQQHEFGCHCMTYWIDEKRGQVFCLIEAPEKKAVEELHRNTHGLVPHRIIEVDARLVESFLGRICDPPDAAITPEGYKVFQDPSFRTLMLTRIQDPVLLRHKLGQKNAQALIGAYHDVVARKIGDFGGVEVEQPGAGHLASFTDSPDAVSCALSIQDALMRSEINAVGSRIGIQAGVPVDDSGSMFGSTLGQASLFCKVAADMGIVAGYQVKERMEKKPPRHSDRKLLFLTRMEEERLAAIYHQLELHAQDPDFKLSDYCRTLAVSHSQLYRFVVSLTGMTPNALLKAYRLEKAMMQLKSGESIAQLAYENGFTSPSYFTKCFKQSFGILPMAFQEGLA